MYLVPSDAITAGKSSNGNHLAYTVLDVVVVSFATPYHSVAYVVSVYHQSNIHFQLLFGACTFSLATYKSLASFVYVTTLVGEFPNVHPFASYVIVIVSVKFDLITT
jgi:hypothetical protein